MRDKTFCGFVENWAWPFSKRESKMATGSSKPASPNTELDGKDLAELHKVLFPARIQYKSFGLQIGVGVDEIACIKEMNQDPGHCLLEILTARLRKSEPLTWNDIDAALREECVGLGNTANDIRKRYPHLFTPTASEHGHEKQVNFEKKRDEKGARHHHHEHTVTSEDILEEEQKGSDYQARMSKERERSSEYYEGIRVGQDAKGKSTESSNKETYHKTRSKPPRKEAEGRDGKREVVSGKKSKKATAPPLERDLPSSEMAQTDSGDGESDESSEDENESEQQSSYDEETENDDLSTAEENEEKRKEKATHPTAEMRKTKSQDDENPRRVKGKKLSIAAGAPSKDDSHGDKEESNAGGSRDQEDQPKKRNRRRHRESSKSPIVRGGSSPSSSQEERKPGSRGKKRNKRGREHKKKSDRKKKGKGDKDGASGIDDSSPECDMKNQSEVETKELASVFECFFGTLCRVPFNPEEIAAQLQKKGLISIPVMKEMIISPESQQAKIISLIDALDEMIKSHPGHLFSCIEVMLKNDVLQEPGREMLNEAGKTNHFLYRALFICTFFFSAKVCPAIAAARFPSQVSPSDLAVVVSPDVVGMQTVTICVATVVCLLRSTFILQRVRGRHKKGCPAQPQKALHSLCLHPVQVQAMLHHLRQRVNQYHNQV